MDRLPVRCQSVWGLIALFVIVGGPLPPAHAQENREDPGIVLPADTGVEDLTKKFNSKDFKNSFNMLITGKEKASKKDLDVIDTAAQWYVYRLTWNPTKPGQSILKVQMEFDSQMKAMVGAKDNKEFAELFTKHLMKHLLEVFQKGPIQSRVYAGVMMQRLAQTGRQELVKDMAAILKGQQPEMAKLPDFVKLYAMKSLKELFELQPAEPAEREKLTAAYTEAVTELIKVVDKSPTIPKEADDAEKQRIIDVTRYLRREAIRALAQARMAAVAVHKAKQQVDGPVAYALLRVLAADGLKPAPLLSEKIEAAFGLCVLKTDGGSPYQSDLALYLVTQFIVTDFAPAYNTDRDRFKEREIFPKPKPPRRGEKPPIKSQTRRIRAEPWKIHKERLIYGLSQLEATAKNAAAKANITKVLKQATRLLAPVQASQQIQQSEIDILEKLVPTLKPSGTEVYRGFNEFRVKVGELSDE